MQATQEVQQALGELLSPRQKFLLLNSLMLCMFISALDNSIVATALPHVLADLGGFAHVSWVFTVYMLSSTVVVPVVGKLSDMFGRKPFILAGVIIFVTSSAACGAAPSMLFLILARGAQGVGGGIIFACVFATLGDLFTPIQRAKYMGYFVGTFTVAALAGPTVGGFLTDGPGWRWCFYLNLPVGLIAMTFIWMNLPFTRKGGRLSSVDFAGAALLSGATISFMLALIWGTAEFGWVSAETIGLFALAATFLFAFVLQERRHPQAILPMFLFRNRVFVQANVIAVFSGAGLFGAIQFLPTFIQTALGASATASGLVSTPQAFGLLATSVIGGQVVSRTGRFKYAVILGGTLTLTAAFLLSTLNVGVPKWHIAVFMVISGLGGGLTGPMMSVIVQSSVTQEFIGVATSGRQFFMQIAQVIGVAVFALVFTTTYRSGFYAHSSAQTKQAIPAAVLARFEDPTLTLDPKRFDEVRASVLALPGGQRLLDDTLNARNQGVATAIDRIFIGSMIAALIVVVAAVTMPEIPLRSTFRSEEPAEEGAKLLEGAPGR